MNDRPLYIGTRDSKLATWQARYVERSLNHAGYRCHLEFIKTEGDATQDVPLTRMGGRGVFTKALDDALLEGRVDLAVHSYKDIPTTLPEGLDIGAVGKREDPRDAMVTNRGAGFLDQTEYRAVVATSSNRRMAQWKARYPKHRITDIRGNIQTRLRKLADNEWDAAIFAAAGLRRLELHQRIDQYLDWMLPAPAQGAIAVMVRSDDTAMREAVRPVHDPDSALCTGVERAFLHELEGGCSAPLGARAWVEGDTVHFQSCLHTLDGSRDIRVARSEQRAQAGDLGQQAAREARDRGADTLLAEVP